MTEILRPRRFKAEVGHKGVTENGKAYEILSIDSDGDLHVKLPGRVLTYRNDGVIYGSCHPALQGLNLL